MAMTTVTANSLSSRPMMPGMNSTGMKTAINEAVIDRMVKPISREPLNAASIGASPASRWRTMFSSMTMASSTTNPTDSVSASNERLSRLNPSRYMPANAPTVEIGSARLAITVAARRRKNKKITRTTSPPASSSVNWTSFTDSRIDSLRS